MSRILLDTGCTRTMVCSRGEYHRREDRCARGDTKLYNLADLTLRVRGVPVNVEAAVAEHYQLTYYWGQMFLSWAT